ncbi:hypothetical protein AB0B66_11390 [Catellatospora sp. NPDC049111]|uniref:hypothetical protein n=1 Tax=Catellatospora sp. NPDC049111 TaxID=3155271 RepID=UPI0034048392
MPIQPKDTTLGAALRLDFTGPRRPGIGPAAVRPLTASPATDDGIGAAVLRSLAQSPEPLTACVAILGPAGAATGTYRVDVDGLLHQVHAQPPPVGHLDADVAVLLGGPATASPADYRALAVAAGVVSAHLAALLGGSLHHVTCDDETIAWPLDTATTHLTTVTGKEAP